MEESRSFRNIGPFKSSSSMRLRRFVVALALLTFLTLLGIFGANTYLRDKTLESSKSASPTIAPTEFVFPTDVPAATPTPLASSTPIQKPSSTPQPTANPVDKATGLNRKELSIAVQNGSGEPGVASKASEYLKGLGYNVVSVGNAQNYDFEQTVIQLSSGKSSFLDLLKKDIALNYTVGSASATLSASDSADAVVIVGKE